jgi:gamma-glutamylputrescine oxidase
LLEAGRLGAGASGRTGGLALDETAVGPLPGLGPVLAGFMQALNELQIECDLQATAAWEITRRGGRQDSPLLCQDSDVLRVGAEVPAATLDPGRLLAGLARAAEAAGVSLHENTPVRELHFDTVPRLRLETQELRAQQVVFAVNGSAQALPWYPADSGLKFTLAVASAPLSDDTLRGLSAEPLKPFYTLELPYLWGRALPGNRLLFGGGLLHPRGPDELAAINVSEGEPAQFIEALESRVCGLVPALASLKFTHRWGGPILFGPAGRPIFCRHPKSQQVLLLGGYTGQGVSLSVYLARWAAEVLLGQREPPQWGQP